MMTDPLVSFVPINAAAISLVGAAGALIQIGQVLDFLGNGVGVAPPNIIGIRPTGFYGVDPGVGRMKPEIQINLGTLPATGNGATPEFAVQYAPDTGTAGNYQPGTWEDAITTGFKTIAQLLNTLPLRLDLPPVPQDQQANPPRYARLIMRPNQTGAAAANLTAGTVTFAGLVMGRDDLVQKFMANNFQVA